MAKNSMSNSLENFHSQGYTNKLMSELNNINGESSMNRVGNHPIKLEMNAFSTGAANTSRFNAISP